MARLSALFVQPALWVEEVTGRQNGRRHGQRFLWQTPRDSFTGEDLLILTASVGPGTGQPLGVLLRRTHYAYDYKKEVRKRVQPL